MCSTAGQTYSRCKWRMWQPSSHGEGRVTMGPVRGSEEMGEAYEATGVRGNERGNGGR